MKHLGYDGVQSFVALAMIIGLFQRETLSQVPRSSDCNLEEVERELKKAEEKEDEAKGLWQKQKAANAAGLTPEREKAMDAYMQAHLADTFTTQDVIRLVELKVESDLLVKEIAYRVSKNVDLTFSVSEIDLDRLKRAGASEDLLEALRSPISAVRFAREHPPDLGPANTASPVQITSEEGGYSLEYPAQPEKKDLAQKDSHGSTYVVMSDNVIYTSGYVVYDQDVGADSELEGNATNVAKEIDAKVTEKKPTRFIRARGDELPALECTIESDKLLGRCLSVVDGRRSYVVGGFSMKPHNGQAEIDRFLKSFKLAPKK